MARSAALNPASMPFFPGGLRTAPEDDVASNSSSGSVGFNGFGARMFRETDRNSFSSHSATSSEYRSLRNSPSPPQQGIQNIHDTRQLTSPGLGRDNQRPSPIMRHTDAGKPYPGIESRIVREGSLLGTLGTLSENEERPSPDEDEEPVMGSGHQTPNYSALALQQQQAQHLQQLQQRQSPPNGVKESSPIPISLTNAGRSFSTTTYSSGSPVSSLDSNGRAISSTDLQAQSFDSQLRASPLFRDILNRLGQSEIVTREITRDLGDLNHKVDLLLERALNSNAQPEFKDPFAPATGGHLHHRPSVGNIAPNQAVGNDDVSSISQRLNMLTSSVGQLLALQTQQLQHGLAPSGGTLPHLPESRASVMGLSTPQLELAPHQVLGSSGLNNPALLGHGLSGRPALRTAARQSSPAMRTWSADNLDLPVRPQLQEIGRQESQLREKRRSSALPRRDSSGIIDPSGDGWSGGSKDNGPIITKWEQLNLAPELLRSLTKFGVGPPNKIQQRALPFLLRGSDIIAQAPPTQERIAAYVIPAIQVAVTNMGNRPTRGPIVIMVSTTVDQATQANRMIRDLGSSIGVKSALAVGSTSSNDLMQELRQLQQNMPHIICGTPQKLHAFFTSPNGLPGSEVRFLVLDEVDQLIARNLHDFVYNIVKLLPPPRSRPVSNAGNSAQAPSSSSGTTFTSPFEPGNPVVSTLQNTGRRFSSAVPSPGPDVPSSSSNGSTQSIERQTALFSNTVPQDVLNLASTIQLREPVRVLVRRDGNVSNAEVTQNSRGLRQFYLYLAFQAGGRADPSSGGGGLGIIGSGRSASSAETTQAREWKLDALADLLEDVDVMQSIVHVGGMTALDAVVYKLASRGFDAIPLHGDMNSVTRLAALNKFRAVATSAMLMNRTGMKVLIVYDVQMKSTEIPQVQVVINYDLPKAVEEYSHRVSPAIASNNYSRAGVVVNFVTATGGDVEMLRSIECFYKIKCPEVPVSLRDVV